MYFKLVPKDFSGVVRIDNNGKTVFEKSFGFRDLANRTPNEANTKFATASAGKAFVAVGIMKLIEEARLELNSTIGSLLKFNLRAIDRAVTVQQLLNHTSGVPDYFDEEVMKDYSDLFHNYPNYRIRSSKDLLPLFIDKPMMYKAGEKFKYNDTGYVLLGMIIEEVSGKSFDSFLHDDIFLPFGMLDTGYYELDRLPANCANSYIYDSSNNEYYTNIYSVDVKGTGAGGAFTTTSDISKFWNGLCDGKVLSKYTFEQMTSPQTDSQTYGYGFWLKKYNDKFQPYFQGSDPGVSFISSMVSGVIIAIVSNYGNDVWNLHKKLHNAVALDKLA